MAEHETGTPDTAAQVGERRPAAARRARIAATAGDLSWLAVGSIATFLVAFAFLFWRTSWGAVDATARDTAIAAALLLAPAPAWLAWMLVAAIADRATPGQQRQAIGVRFTGADRRWKRLLRFAIHPLGAPGWLWCGAIIYLLEVPLLSWLLFLVAAATLLSGLGSAFLLAVGRPALHDQILRSRVEASA